MSTSRLLLSVAAACVLSACASRQQGAAPPPPTAPATGTATAPAAPPATTSTVKSRDGSYSGQVTGTPVPGSRFASLKIGMQMREVQESMGRAPDRWHTYESGKRWIPFYFGNDARRLGALYKGEGCLTFTEGNIWGGAGGDLIAIMHDASGACYQP